MGKYKKVVIILLICLMPFAFADNTKQQEANKHDYLYSQEYFTLFYMV